MIKYEFAGIFLINSLQGLIKIRAEIKIIQALFTNLKKKKNLRMTFFHTFIQNR